MAVSEVAIRVEGLSKRFSIGVSEVHHTLGEALSAACRAPLRRVLQRARPSETLWALRDVGFEVRRGEVLGVIGRNGAGKSTLLKILSRITSPSAGRVELRGRVGSLLEVGTGFHPELTGRENVELNGAILGMSRAEIRARFDEIVAFSGVERFLDTPVKRYSTGMRVRLAFAVAAHLEPEILLIDEVLAVGDAEFQRKCLGKMSEVARGGRTVVFVSHNMNAVQQLCGRGIVLDAGRVSHAGPVADAVDHYFSGFARDVYGSADLEAHPGRDAGYSRVARSIQLLDTAGAPTDTVKTGDDLVIEIEYDCGDAPIDVVQLGVETLGGERLLTVGSHQQLDLDLKLLGRGVVRCRLPQLPLGEGEYSLMVAFGTRLPWRNVDFVEAAVRFRVRLGDFFGTGNAPTASQGNVVLRSQWEVESRP